MRRPFGVGDRIQIGQHTGDVVDIRPFRFVLMEVGNWVKAEQSTGRVIHVPNALIFKNPVANYDEAFGYIWNELEVTVTIESDWKSAKAELLRIVAEHAEHLTADVTERIRLAADSLHIKFGKVTPVVWTSVVDDGVRLTARYLCKPRDRRGSSSENLGVGARGVREDAARGLRVPDQPRVQQPHRGQAGRRHGRPRRTSGVT